MDVFFQCGIYDTVCGHEEETGGPSENSVWETREFGGGGKSIFKSLTPLLDPLTVNFPPVRLTNSERRQPTRQIKTCVMMYSLVRLEWDQEEERGSVARRVYHLANDAVHGRTHSIAVQHQHPLVYISELDVDDGRL